jgi:hypothetical protein
MRSRRSLETGAQLPLSPLLNQPHRSLEFRRVFPEGVVLEASEEIGRQHPLPRLCPHRRADAVQARRAQPILTGKAVIRRSTNPIASNEAGSRHLATPALFVVLTEPRSAIPGSPCPDVSDRQFRLTQTFYTALIVFRIPERENAAAALDGEFRVDPERLLPGLSSLLCSAKVAVARRE